MRYGLLRRFYSITIVSSNQSSESFVSSMPGGCSNQVVRFLADCGPDPSPAQGGPAGGRPVDAPSQIFA